MRTVSNKQMITNSDIFLISNGIIIIVAVGIQYFLWKNRKNDKKSIDIDWQKFVAAESKNDHFNIKLYGNRLIWNKYLKKEQLEKIIEVANTRKTNFPDAELDQLANNVLNKKLHYDRNLYESGSSGGIKQSW